MSPADAPATLHKKEYRRLMFTWSLPISKKGREDKLAAAAISEGNVSIIDRSYVYNYCCLITASKVKKTACNGEGCLCLDIFIF